VAEAVNLASRTPALRKLLERTLQVDARAPLPRFYARSGRRRVKALLHRPQAVQAAADTRGQVALFATCYGNRNQPQLLEDLVAVFQHNGIGVALPRRERCCGMPKLELGDFESIERMMRVNIPELDRLVQQGYDLVAPIPSCVLMFKQELPRLFPQEEAVQRVARRTFDPFEYLMLRHKAGLLRTEFKQALGRVSYQVPCHLRVQNIGLKTRDLLRLIPGTTLDVIERCSGHDGTYAVKSEFRDASMQIGRPVMQRIEASACDHYSSDCPMAAQQIASGLPGARPPTHPLRLLRLAYGI
jgi:Fe-S oxidoreductase